MGDTAMCINPNDPKNRWLSGKKVIVPLVNRIIPVIEDDYVDIEFGTGCSESNTRPRCERLYAGRKIQPAQHRYLQ